MKKEAIFIFNDQANYCRKNENSPNDVKFSVFKIGEFSFCNSSMDAVHALEIRFEIQGSLNILYLASIAIRKKLATVQEFS